MSESTITKKAIALAFKEVMKEKLFDKITINDITTRCGINRQTFYYHFEDRYDLMNWIYYNEIFLPLVENLDENNYSESFKSMFDKMYQEKDFYYNAFSMTAEYGFKEYLFSVLEQLILIITGPGSEKKESLSARFYTYGLLGIITDWVKQGMKNTPEEIVQELNSIIKNIKRKY